MKLLKIISYSKNRLSINDMKLLSISFIYGFFMSCSNNPYPNEGQAGKTLYTTFKSAAKNLDPQQSYTMVDLAYLRLCYEPLVDYHYTDSKKLIPALATSVPVAKVRKNNQGKVEEVRYSFTLRQGVYFIDDACFKKGSGRELTAKDFEYAFKRVSDPTTNCPIYDSLSFIKGFKKYGQKISKVRQTLKAKQEFQKGTESYINSHNLYKQTGDFDGIEITGKYSFDLILSE